MYIKEYFPLFSALSCPFLLTPSHSQLIPPIPWLCSWILILFCDPLNFTRAHWLLLSFRLLFWNSLQAAQRCYKCLIIRAAPSSVTHSQHLGQLWVSIYITTIHWTEGLLWLRLRQASACYNILLHVFNQSSERWGDNPLEIHDYEATKDAIKLRISQRLIITSESHP